MKVKLISADCAGTLQKASRQGITLAALETVDPLTVCFQIPDRDLKRLRLLCEQRGDRLEVIRKAGLSQTVRKLLKRPCILIGIPAMTAFFLWIPTRVLFIEVCGNHQVPSAEILETAEASGLRFGCLRRNVRSEQIKNRLLQKIPELNWAGINTRGCVAEISVREWTAAPSPRELPAPASIVAARDGVITKCTALRGEALCRPGQAVKKGEVLISGILPAGDSQLYTQADGEVYAGTERILCGILPASSQKKGEKQGASRNIFLVCGKNRIKILGSSGNWDATCGRMYQEYYITLPGGYRLPFGLAVSRYQGTQLHLTSDPPRNLQEILSAAAEAALKERMVAGSILAKKERFSVEHGTMVLKGQYVCNEMIGRIRQDMIGE